jgi:hypothetical protein
MPITGRAMEWLRRYLPAELLSMVATLLCAMAAMALCHNQAVAAVAGTWAENLAYYGLIVARDLRASGRRSPGSALATLRDIVLEFGPSELLDSLLIRPAALYTGMALAPDAPATGLLAGKLAADLVFYLPTITSYELLRRRRA